LLTLVYAILVVDLALLDTPPLSPFERATPWDPAILCRELCNGVPTRTIAMQLRHLDQPGVARQLVGNLALLIPFGIALPILWPSARRPLGILATIVLLGVAVEAAQVVIDLSAGAMVRSLDIDDALLNATGVAIGYAIWWLGDRLGRPMLGRDVRASRTSSPLP
jgi:glycopeptide antibiotics resistance protein